MIEKEKLTISSLTPFCCTHHSWGEGNTIAIPLFWHFTWMHFICWEFCWNFFLPFSSSSSSLSCYHGKDTCSCANSWSHCFSLAPSKLTSVKVMAIGWWRRLFEYHDKWSGNGGRPVQFEWNTHRWRFSSFVDIYHYVLFFQNFLIFIINVIRLFTLIILL